MIEELKEIADKRGSKVKSMEGNIIEIKDKFQEDSFDLAFCIGNSLVHLDNLEEIERFFKDTKAILKEILLIKIILMP